MVGLHILRKILLCLIGVVGSVSVCLILVSNNLSKLLELPIEMNSQGIVLESIQEYSGLYFEDDRNDEVHGIASAIFINSGDHLLESAYIELYTPNSCYSFEISMLPAGMRVWVLDVNKSLFTDSEIIDHYFFGKFSNQSLCEDVSVELLKDGACILSNDNISVVESISLYHRKWDENREICYGSKSYKTHIENLGPGNQIMIMPGYTFPEDCKLIYIS